MARFLSASGFGSCGVRLSMTMLMTFFRRAFSSPKISIVFLPEHRLPGMQPARDEIQCDIQGVSPALIGVEQRCHRMVIGDEIIRLAFVLQLDRRAHHPEVISDVETA